MDWKRNAIISQYEGILLLSTKQQNRSGASSVPDTTNRPRHTAVEPLASSRRLLHQSAASNMSLAMREDFMIVVFPSAGLHHHLVYFTAKGDSDTASKYLQDSKDDDEDMNIDF